MASLRDIRRRIRSVRNVSQITKAMDTVAASRLRRAQERVLASRPVQNEAMVLVSPNRGLAGPLPGNINRRATQYLLREAQGPVGIVAVGKKGRDFMGRRGQQLLADFTGIGDRPAMGDILPVAQIVI